jgi:hypothetical protein
VPEGFEVEITGKRVGEEAKGRGTGVVVVTDIETRYEPV